MLTREEKKYYRRRMFEIVGDRSVDELPEDEFKRVRKIGKLIGIDSMDAKSPLPKMDLENFTFDDYWRIRQKGYTVKAMRKALGVETNEAKWIKWRKENLGGKKNA